MDDPSPPPPPPFDGNPPRSPFSSSSPPAAVGADLSTPADCPRFKEDPQIGLTVLPGFDCSVLSTLLHGHDSIEVPYEHPLVRFFSLEEANELRLVHSEFVVAVGATRFNARCVLSSSTLGSDRFNRERHMWRPWRHLYPRRWGLNTGIAAWAACFPAAEVLWLGSGRALDDAALCARRGELASLRVLDAAFAEGADDAALRLTESLPHMPALSTLALSRLFCNGENALDLVAALPGLPALEHLELSRNDAFYAVCGRDFAAALPRLAALRSLDLNFNRIGDEGIVELVEGLGALGKQLTTLGLSSTACGIVGARALASVLPKLIALESLDLSQNDELGAVGVTELMAAVQEIPALRELNLSYCALGNVGAEAVAAALPKLLSLATLDLQGNEIGEDGARALAGTLSSLVELTMLDVSEQSINDVGASAIAASLPSLRSLTALHLGCCGFGPAGAKDLAAALSGLGKLTLLGLNGNAFGAAGAICLAASIPSLAALTTLQLGDTDLGDAGFSALAPAVAHLPALSTLNLRRNVLGHAGARALAAVLPRLAALEELDLSMNEEIGSAGVQDLAVAFSCSGGLKLKALNLTQTAIDEVGALALAAALPRLATLVELKLSSNNIGSVGVCALAAALPSLRASRGSICTILLVEISVSGRSLKPYRALRLLRNYTLGTMA